MYTERKEMVRDRRNERVVRGEIGIPRNYRKERLSGRFSLEQIAADLPAGSLISGLLQPLIFLRFAWNFTLCSSSLLFSLSSLPPTRDPLYRVGLPSIAFYSLLRKNRTRGNGSDTSSLPFHPRRLLFLSPSNSFLLFLDSREKGSSIEEERSRDRLDSSPVTEISFNPHSTRYFPVTNIREGIDSICTSVARAGSRNGVRERTVLNVGRGKASRRERHWSSDRIKLKERVSSLHRFYSKLSFPKVSPVPKGRIRGIFVSLGFECTRIFRFLRIEKFEL